jgi:hypothetical protein
MKKHLARTAIILGALLLLLGACSNFFEDPPTESPAPEAQATLKLSIPGDNAKTLAPAPGGFGKYVVNVYAAYALEAGGAPTIPGSTIPTGLSKTINGEFGNVEFTLDPGVWNIEIVGYAGEVASVKGTALDVDLYPGEVKTVSVLLNEVVTSDVYGTFSYNIAIPNRIVDLYIDGSTTSKNRDPYGNVADTTNGYPFPDDEFDTSGLPTTTNYFSGAVLRIIPDVDAAAGDISAEPNSEYVLLDLLYGDLSPSQGGNNNPINPKRYAEGKIQLPAGRYKLYLSLVSDRAIYEGNSASVDTENYIGIFKEEVVYIYPNAVTSTPDSYTTFTDKDLDAQVYFEGQTHISYGPGNSPYTAVQVQVSRSNYPSHYYGSGSSYLWTAAVSNNEWQIYIPAWELGIGYQGAPQGHLDVDSDQVYFRFMMTGAGRTLYSPWQQYVTREIQGQIDIDLHATINTLTLNTDAGTKTVQIETGHRDSIARIGNTNVYDIVRGVNFTPAPTGDTSPYVEDVLITVKPPAGKAIASFDPRNSNGSGYADINWSYADGDRNDYDVTLQIPIQGPSDDKPIIYVLDNSEAYSLDHYTDNGVGINTDLGTSAVEVDAKYFDFRGSIQLNLTNLPPNVNMFYIDVLDADGSGRVVARQAVTPSGNGYSWSFAPAAYLPVYYDGFAGAYYDYDIYAYDMSGRYVDFGGGPYDNGGVQFRLALEDFGVPVAATQLTRRYAAPELVNELARFGISTAENVDYTGTFDDNLPGRNGYGYGYYTDSDAQYYYFFSNPDFPYTLEYQDYSYNSDPALTDIAVTVYDSNGYLLSVSDYPSQGMYGRPNGSADLINPAVNELVTVQITRSYYGEGNGYKFKLDSPQDYTPTASTTEAPLQIREGTRKYYKINNPAAGTLHSVLFQDNAVYGNYADITVYAYSNGNRSDVTTHHDGNGTFFRPTNSSTVILEIVENSGNSSDTPEYSFNVATSTTLSAANMNLTTGSIREGTIRYYRAAVTLGDTYKLAFLDSDAGTGATANINYVEARYYTGTYTYTTLGTNYTGDNSEVTITIPGVTGELILVVDNTNVLSDYTGQFGIRLHP